MIKRIMSSDKRRIFAELIEEVRRSQTATARFDGAVADAVGINQTDLRCLDVLGRTGPLAAGQLAEQTGLSSGAMTTAIDRLERAGYVRRGRDPGDRRRVVVELTSAALVIADHYAEHAALSEVLYRGHTAAEMEMLLRFVRAGRELNERRAFELEGENLGRQRQEPDRTGSSRGAPESAPPRSPDPAPAPPPAPAAP
jgi:DNA-binding MarR family transcriptional regulator